MEGSTFFPCTSNFHSYKPKGGHVMWDSNLDLAENDFDGMMGWLVFPEGCKCQFVQHLCFVINAKLCSKCSV